MSTVAVLLLLHVACIAESCMCCEEHGAKLHALWMIASLVQSCMLCKAAFGSGWECHVDLGSGIALSQIDAGSHWVPFCDMLPMQTTT